MSWLQSLDKRISSAAMIITNDNNEALIVKAHYKEHWTFPGGVIDAGETPLQAACRETREEVGLDIDPADVTFTSVATRKSADAETYQFVFTSAKPYSPHDTVTLQVSEIDTYRFVSREEVVSSNRHYGQVIEHWARGTTGYVEQRYG